MPYKTIDYINEYGEPDSYDIWEDDYGNEGHNHPDTKDDSDKLDPDEVQRETQKKIWGTPPDTKSQNFLDQLGGLPTWFINQLKTKFTKPGTDGEIDWGNLLGAGAGLVGAYKAYQQAEAGNKPVGYQGGIPSYTAIQGRAAEPMAGSSPGDGHQYFTGIQFANNADPAAIPAAQATRDAQLDYLNKSNVENAKLAAAQRAAQQTVNPITSDKFFGNVPKAAYGGLMGLAHGGKPINPRGTYLRGNTDGMADKIPGTIDGVQPARLAHGEFVIPADVVSHLGNGNSDAGAQQLYKMMEKIRMARTGNPKQGKEINPNKFMPGGLAHYAMGGRVQRFDGTTTSTVKPAGATGTESNLSNWAGPYVTDLMGKTQALTGAALRKPEFYKGKLAAGQSDLQNKAYSYAGNLSTPTSIGAAANTAGNIATNLSNTSAYSPTTATNQYNAPTAYAPNAFTNQYNAPTAYQPTTAINQYNAPDAYKSVGSEFGADQANQYMNPYLQMSLQPQIEEARRQSQITQMQNAARMAKAGSFGGGRQAIMDAETQRNLGTKLAEITGQGYNTAFSNAQQQFNADQLRKIQESQYGSTQGMTAAQMQAQYGLSAEEANEKSRQFAANQAMNAAANRAQYGLSAEQEAEKSKQFGSTQGMTAAANRAQYGLSAEQEAEKSRQFGANYGIDAQKAGLAAAQAQGQLGSMQNQTSLANLNTLATLGNTQQATEQAGLEAAQKQFELQKADPYKQLQFQQSMLQGMPTTAQSYNTTTNPLAAAAAGGTGFEDLFKSIFGDTTKK
jgi:hypothetical protein